MSLARSLSDSRSVTRKASTPCLIGQQGDRPGPVGAPQAAIEAEGVEDAAQRIPDVLVGKRLVAQRAGAADLDRDVLVRRQGQQQRQLGPRLGRRRRHERLLQAEMIDHQGRVGIANGELSNLLQAPAAHQVDHEGVLRSSGQHAVDAGVCGIGRYVGVHHDAHRHRAVDRRPLGDRLGDLGIVRIDRLDQPEPAGMGGMDGQRVARIVAVHGEHRGQQPAIDTDGIHGLHHVLARDLRWPGQNLGPRAARMIAFVAVNLGIDCHHEIRPPRPLSFSKGLSHFLAKLAEPALP